MVDIRKIVIILLISVLFSILVFSVIEAVYPSPDYQDFCNRVARPMPLKVAEDCPLVEVSELDQDACTQKKGYIEYEYDSRGCATNYFCNTCQNEYNEVQEEHRRVVFYVSALFALIAIFVGIYLPANKNPLNEWVGTGFMLGGAFVLIFGTATSFTALDRIARPIVIFCELMLVLFITYRKMSSFRADKKRRKR